MTATHTLGKYPAKQTKTPLSRSRTGYGSKQPTSWMVHVRGRWRRVYCCIWSNIGTCFIGKSIRSGEIIDSDVPVPLATPQ